MELGNCKHGSWFYNFSKIDFALCMCVLVLQNRALPILTDTKTGKPIPTTNMISHQHSTHPLSLFL